MEEKAGLNCSRKELYDKVWNEPLTKIAKEYDISYSKLRETCKTHNIPVPPNGYWMKLKYAKPTNQKPLIGNHNVEIRIAPNLPKLDKNKLPEKLKVPKKLPKKLDPIVAATKAYLENGNKPPRTIHAYLERNDHGTISCSVNKTQESRALRLLNTLVIELKALGYHFKFNYYNCFLIMKGLEFEMSMREKYKRVPREKPSWEGQTDLIPTGFLLIHFKHRYSSERVFHDTKTITLEERLPRILQILQNWSEKEYAEHLQHLEWSKAQEEREKQEKLFREKRDHEIKRFEEFIKQSERWEFVQRLRAFVKEYENKLANIDTPTSDQQDFIDFAKRKIDWLDPTVSIEDELFEDVNPSRFLDQK